MPTKYYSWPGSISWVKVFEPDNYDGAERWIVNFYPDNMQEVIDSGCQAKPKEDQNGDLYIRLRRPTKAVFGDEVTKFCPPRLTGQLDVKYVDKLSGEDVYSHKVSQGIEVERVGDRVSIGNGTRANVRVSVYDTSRGKGTRLDGLEITDLVVYEGNDTAASDNNGEANVEKAKKAEKKVEKTGTNKAAPWD